MNQWPNNAWRSETSADFSSTPRPKLELISSTRRRTLELLYRFDQETLDCRTNSSRWSPGEVFDHLIRFDGFFLSDAQKLISSACAGQSTKISYSLRELDVAPACIPKAVLPLFKVPLTIASSVTPRTIQNFVASTLPIQHPEFATPERQRPKSELTNDLKESLAKYEEVFQTPNIDFSKLEISHPLLGTRNMAGLPEFVSIHEKRHIDKMLNLLNRQV